MITKKLFSYLFFNGLFFLIAVLGMAGLYLTKLPGSIWISIIWALWILANYLILIRIKVCRYCSYYGRHGCPMGWGIFVPFLISQGDTDKFSTQSWPLIYFVSLAVLPSLSMIICLIFYWDLFVGFIFILFGFFGLIIYRLVRTECCNNCQMKTSCLLSKLNHIL